MSGAIDARARGMISRGIVNLVDGEKRLQELQIEALADERHDGVEHFQPYGFTSNPHPDAEAIVVCAGGLRSHMIAIMVSDRRYRLLDLESGEVALFDDLGNVVKLGRERIEVVGVAEVKVTAPKVIVDSDDVNLGGTGGQKVARVGDSVVGGIITSGSDKVKAA